MSDHTKEEIAAMQYADTGIELVQNIFERTPSKYGFEDFDDVINKNLVVANLSRKANEPEIIMRKADNIITYKRFAEKQLAVVGWNRKIIKNIPPEKLSEIKKEGKYEILEEEGVYILLEPVIKEVSTNRFIDLMREDLAAIQTVAATSAGTDASIMQLMRSTFIQKGQTIEDRTAPKKTFMGRNKE